MKNDSRFIGLLASIVLVSVLAAVAESRPGYFTNLNILGGLLLLQVVIAIIWHYEQWFFAVMMLSFIWAGTDLPLSGAGSIVRWVFLGVGAFVGVIKWAEHERRQHFSTIHLVALLCVLAALVSSLVSRRPEISLLKSGSFFLLFLYVSCGGRVAVIGREKAFFAGLVTACEVIAYFSAICYWGLHFEVFGNPNSLGAVMGVAVVPILLWALLSAEERQKRQRLGLALLLAAGLLYSSVSRAGILACVMAISVMCIALRRHLLFVKGAFAMVFLVAIVAIVQPAKFDALVDSFTEDMIYKGHEQQGLLASREAPWRDTMNVIKESPWFGSGFGTDPSLDHQPTTVGMFSTVAGLAREHGNSYLALVGYVGLLGLTPFLAMLGIVARYIYSGCANMRRTRDVTSYSVPLVMVCVAALVHAFFEDWLFAVGFHLTIFFWVLVFVLAEMQSGWLRETRTASQNWNRIAWRARPVPVTMR